MTISVDHDVDEVTAAVRDLLADGWAAWPCGYPDEIELALIDAVFSIRAQYGRAGTQGREATGVRGVVQRWREHRGDQSPDLRRLADTDPVVVREIFRNDTITSGRPKSSAVVEAAGSLAAAGIVTPTDVSNRLHEAKRAYVRVHGLGWVTFSYFCMLLGIPDVKSDVWITRFVGTAVGREVTSREAYDLMHDVAGTLAADGDTAMPRKASELDHAIWSAVRRRGSAAG